MIDTATLQVYLTDPTRTTVLRNLFAKAVNKRFNELVSVVRQAIVVKDVFGLNLQINQMTVPPENAFSFPLSQDKIAAFMQWLDEQVKAGILEVGIYNQLGSSIESAWLNMYILDSYKRGIIRARYEMINAGANIPTLEESGGIDVVLNSAIHLDRLGILYTRVFSELKGIISTMDQVISRILTQGIADGDGPELLARKLVAAINGTGIGDLGLTDTLGRYISPMRRAEMLARTEIIRAHHWAMIQEYRNWGIAGVNVLAEFVTAGDLRVCSRCDTLAKGSPYTLDQIQNVIPLHPQCRCVALPFIIK